VAEPEIQVVNVRDGGYTIYIGRGSCLGNPFVIGKDGDRNQVIEKYRVWLPDQPELMKTLDSLRDEILGCYCHPLPCHGDVLVQLVRQRDFIIDVANRLEVWTVESIRSEYRERYGKEIDRGFTEKVATERKLKNSAR